MKVMKKGRYTEAIDLFTKAIDLKDGIYSKAATSIIHLIFFHRACLTDQPHPRPGIIWGSRGVSMATFQQLLMHSYRLNSHSSRGLPRRIIWRGRAYIGCR